MPVRRLAEALMVTEEDVLREVADAFLDVPGVDVVVLLAGEGRVKVEVRSATYAVCLTLMWELVLNGGHPAIRKSASTLRRHWDEAHG